MGDTRLEQFVGPVDGFAVHVSGINLFAQHHFIGGIGIASYLGLLLDVEVSVGIVHLGHG